MDYDHVYGWMSDIVEEIMSTEPHENGFVDRDNIQALLRAMEQPWWQEASVLLRRHPAYDNLFDNLRRRAWSAEHRAQRLLDGTIERTEYVDY